MWMSGGDRRCGRRRTEAAGLHISTWWHQERLPTAARPVDKASGHGAAGGRGDDGRQRRWRSVRGREGYLGSAGGVWWEEGEAERARGSGSGRGGGDRGVVEAYPPQRLSVSKPADLG